MSFYRTPAARATTLPYVLIPNERQAPRNRWDVFISGSLRHSRVIEVTQALADAGLSVFSDWRATAPDADDHWKAYEQARGRDYTTALASPAARNVVNFDRTNLENSNSLVLVYPAGRSAHMELGYALGLSKPGFVLLDADADNDRWDVMLGMATGVYRDMEELVKAIRGAVL